MFALLIPLVLSLAPQLAGMIFGSKGADATTKVAAVVQTVVGAAADLNAPGGVAAAVAHIQSDPQASAELAAKLADLHLQMQKEQDVEAESVRQNALDELKTRLSDTASARTMTTNLAQAHSGLAYGSVVVSVVIVVAVRVDDLFRADQPSEHIRRSVRIGSGRHARRHGHAGRELLVGFQPWQFDEERTARERAEQPGEQRAVCTDELSWQRLKENVNRSL